MTFHNELSKTLSLINKLDKTIEFNENHINSLIELNNDTYQSSWCDIK